MNDEAPLPRFRKPPVIEVVLGVQLYYEKVKLRFPKIQVHPPLLPVFETFGTSAVAGPQGTPYPHFDAVQAVFTNAFMKLETLEKFCSAWQLSCGSTRQKK
jgi:hypothetical protein